MNKLYSVHDHWTDINKKNDVDIESIDGVITGIKVNGEDYGGIEWQNIYDNTINTVLDSDGFYTTNIGVVIEADSIRVTFDGVEYSCPKRSISEISTNFYGAPTPLETGEESFDWTDFPFSIVTGSNGASMVVTTQTAGTHTLKIDTPQSGGGESDLTTAKVDVYFTFEGEPIVLDVAQIMFYIGYPEDATNLNGQYFVAMALNNGASETHPILYKGVATAGYDTGHKDGNPYIIGGTPTVTGDIELDFETSSIIIKGDGTITFSLVED